MNSNFLTSHFGTQLFQDRLSVLKVQDTLHCSPLLIGCYDPLTMQVLSKYILQMKVTFFKIICFQFCFGLQPGDTGSNYHNYWPYRLNISHGIKRLLDYDSSYTFQETLVGARLFWISGLMWVDSFDCCFCLGTFHRSRFHQTQKDFRYLRSHHLIN